MLTYLFECDRLVADFVAWSKNSYAQTKNVPFKKADFADENLRAIGILNDRNELVAGIVYYHWCPEYGTIEMSIDALPKQRWLTRTTLALMYQYPFIQCGCQMVMTRTSVRNKHVLRMLKAMNFDLIVIPRILGRNEDAVLALLTYEKWVESKFCRRFGHHLLEIKQEQAA